MLPRPRIGPGIVADARDAHDFLGLRNERIDHLLVRDSQPFFHGSGASTRALLMTSVSSTGQPIVQYLNSSMAQ